MLLGSKNKIFFAFEPLAIAFSLKKLRDSGPYRGEEKTNKI
jgi:hypothetical protein